MANVKINSEKLPILFGEKNRPSEVVENKNDLKLEGQDFQYYTPKAGYTYRFPSFDESIIRKQQVVEGGTAYQYLIGCMSSPDGRAFVEDWFSLNHLGKLDAANKPVHPSWRALGNIFERAKRLCEKGELSAKATPRSIQQVVFEKGKPVKVVARDDAGQPILENGEPKLVNKTEPRDIYDLTPAD